MVEIHQKHTK